MSTNQLQVNMGQKEQAQKKHDSLLYKGTLPMEPLEIEAEDVEDNWTPLPTTLSAETCEDRRLWEPVPTPAADL